MEIAMKPRKHRHKESFSILLISNTGQNSRQFHVTHVAIRLFVTFMLLLCAVFGWLMYQYLSGFESGNGSAGKSANESQTELLEKLSSQEELIRELEEEKETLSGRNDELTTENKALLEAAKGKMETDAAVAEQTTQTPEDDAAFPSRYPYSEPGVLTTKYSDDHPYVSIDTDTEGDVIAAGDGTVTHVGSDDTYPLIIEIEHGNGYKTRYMFLQEAEAIPANGAQVQGGAVLATLDEDNVQLDYQVIFEGEPIDPLIVFEAKG